MAKANIALKNGTTVAIEGTAEEVAALLAKFSETQGGDVNRGQAPKKRRGAQKAAKPRKDGPTGLVGNLAEQGYFKAKRTISDIQKKLEEGGFIYPVTSISPVLTRMTKRRDLRRLKEEGVWKYVG